MTELAAAEGTSEAPRRSPITPDPMAWSRLEGGLDRWADAGRSASFWWRDDDAERASPALDRLIGLAADAGVPLSLAVIPAELDEALAAALPAEPPVAVLQHGYRHRNHAPGSEKKAELGRHRPAASVLAELAEGRERLARTFRTRFLPILVPPWNRIDPALAAALAGEGYRGLSTYGPRRGEFALAEVNTHIDPVDWSSRRFLGTEPAVMLALRHLQGKREGRLDPDEPTGLLTHHLMHDGETWGFIRTLLERTRRHPAARWLSAEDAFALPSGMTAA
jgi:hypothetical protein